MGEPEEETVAVPTRCKTEELSDVEQGVPVVTGDNPHRERR